MELVPGVDLAERLRSGRLSIAEAIDIAVQITEALEAAHERGVVHRDLKPANVKLTPDGKVKVLDFGLAKALDAAASQGDGRDASMSPTITSLGTVSGVILGTAAYMSPEAARGRTVDKRADVWAFGCMLYEMLSGKLAFAGETVSDTMAAVLTREPDWAALPARTSPLVRGLLARCLQKDPKERLRDIGDARIELREGTHADRAVETGPAAASKTPRWVYGVLHARRDRRRARRPSRRPTDDRHAASGLSPIDHGKRHRALGAIHTGRRHGDLRRGVRRAPSGSVFDASRWGRIAAHRPAGADVAGISRDSRLALLIGRRHEGSWLRTGTLAQVALTGGTPRELLENVFDADISPDGSQFAVVLGDGGEQVLQYPIGKEVFRTHGWIGQPRIAPDGRRVAFVDHRIWGDDLGEIKLVGADGKVERIASEQQYKNKTKNRKEQKKKQKKKNK
jgi:hypothetical protein